MKRGPEPQEEVGPVTTPEQKVLKHSTPFENRGEKTKFLRMKGKTPLMTDHEKARLGKFRKIKKQVKCP